MDACDPRTWTAPGGGDVHYIQTHQYTHTQYSIANINLLTYKRLVQLADCIGHIPLHRKTGVEVEFENPDRMTHFLLARLDIVGVSSVVDVLKNLAIHVWVFGLMNSMRKQRTFDEFVV